MKESIPSDAYQQAQKYAFPRTPELDILLNALTRSGAKPVAVGGAVRDILLGMNPKDIDIEVFGLERDKLFSVLTSVGRVDEVGAQFGIFKVSLKNLAGTLTTFDVSLPRRENKVGAGHKGFSVQPDHLLSFEDAARRRDFTINAMGYDFIADQLIDPFGGVDDLRERVLRHVSAAFGEDPLRVLRAAQFAARLSCKVAPETITLCQELASELKTLPKERIYVEIEKLLLSLKPSLGLAILRETNALVLFPELSALIDCPQEPQWHPEGDVWIHTLMVVDEAALLVKAAAADSAEALLIVMAALCHDLGKPSTTQREGERIRSKNHDIAGEKPTISLLTTMGFPKKFIDETVPLVREHLKPMQLYHDKEKVSDSAIRRLSTRVSIEKLCMVATADFLGRTTKEALSRHDPSTEWLMNRAKVLSVETAPPEALLLGRHLMELGVKPGPAMGRLLSNAYDAQLEGDFSDLTSAMEWARSQKFSRG